MSNKFIFRWGTTPSTGIPAALQDPDLMTGRYRDPQGQIVTCGIDGGSKRSSEKATRDMQEALCAAKLTYLTGADAVGYNSNYMMAEITDRSDFEVPPTFGDSVRIAIALPSNKKGKKILMSVNGKPVKSNDIKAWHIFYTTVPYLMSEFAEFAAAFDKFCNTTDDDEMRASMLICAGYFYYVIGATNAPMPITDDDFVNVGSLSGTTIQSAKMAPDTYIGVFKDFVASGRVQKQATNAPAFIAPKDWNGRYRLIDEAFFTPEEKALIPVLDDKYVISQEIDDIAKMIKWAIDSNAPVNFNNILLRSAPGYGKSTVYVMLAAAFGLPLRTLALNAMSEPLDLVGSFVPLSGEIKTVREMAGSNIPSADDVYLDPEWAYEQITGVKKPGATAADCQNAIMLEAAKRAKLEAESALASDTDKSKTRVEFVPGIVPAMARPCMVGLDEISMPMNAGVVPVLHPLMDDTNAYTLPTGEVVTRHPLTILVSTTNLELEGNRAINQAFQDRNALVIDMAAPSNAELKRRLIANTKFDESQYPNINIDDFVRCYTELRSVAAKSRLTDGTIGPRKLSHWLLATMAIGSPRKAAEMTIIPGGTADKNGQALLREKVEAIFSH